MPWRLRLVSFSLLPLFVIGQVLCFCAPVRAAAPGEKVVADHACCQKDTEHAHRDRAPADGDQHRCDHCRGVQALIAQKSVGQNHTVKLLTPLWSPLHQTSAIESPAIEFSSISSSFVLDQPPPDLFIRYCALLN